jgi:two-component system LytT family response regulator
VVDDEPVACATLQKMISAEQDLVLMGCYNDSSEAVEAISKYMPDLIFLDIEMPEMDGFQMIKQIKPSPHVIFVTAYEEFAVKAFDLGAVDYILKPFDRRRFQKAVARARERIHRRFQDSGGPQRSHYLTRITVNREGEIFFIQSGEIDWIEAKGKYVILHCGKNLYLLKLGIRKLEEQLDPKQFVRIHRSSIVNVNRIDRILAWFYGDYRLLLKDGTELNLSRFYKENLYKMIGRPISGQRIKI